MNYWVLFAVVLSLGNLLASCVASEEKDDRHYFHTALLWILIAESWSRR